MILGRIVALIVSRLQIRGRQRLAYRLAHRYNGTRSWRKLPFGNKLKISLPGTSVQSWIVAFTRAYDQAEVSMLMSHFRPGTVALDIGASLGLYTVQLAEKAREIGARVVAIEPVPANASVIRSNLYSNELDEFASVQQVALGSQEGSLVMKVERGGAGNATVTTGVTSEEMARHSLNGHLGPEVAVAVTTLDHMTFDLPVSIVKIDVEGFEMDVLGGGERFISEHRPVIFAEFNSEWMSSRGADATLPFDWAIHHHYSVFAVVQQRMGLILSRNQLLLKEISSPEEREGAELLLVPVSALGVQN